MPQALADAFITRLIESGIVPNDTVHVIIDAKVSRVTMLHYSRIVVDEDILLALAPRVEDGEVRGRLTSE